MPESAGLGDEAMIREMLDDWLAALSAKQAEGVVAHYVAAPVLYTLAPPLVAEDGDAAGLNEWFATWRGPLAYERRDVEIAAAGDVAFCHCLTRLTGTKTDGARNDIWFRHTLGLRKIEGKWKIAHEHASVPFYMDEREKAAVDLKP